MSWHALGAIDDAIEGTRSFLSLVSLRGWAKLALVSIFVGTGGGSLFSLLNVGSSIPSEDAVDSPSAPPNGSGDANATAGMSSTGELPPSEIIEMASAELPLVLAITVGLVGLVLGIRLVSDVLRFVFYDDLHTNRIAVVDPAKRRFGQSLRLFGFTLALQVLTLGPFVAVGAALAFGVDLPTSPPALLAGGVLAAGLLLASTFVGRITHEFVVPILVLTDGGVLDGWRRFWPVFRGQLAQFGVYLVVHFVVLLVIGVVRSILSGIVYLSALLVGGLIGLGVVLGAFGGVNAAAASTPALVVLGLLAVLTLLLGWLLLLPVRIVILSYVTIYEVSVLAAADDDLRLRPRDDDDLDRTTVTD